MEEEPKKQSDVTSRKGATLISDDLSLFASILKENVMATTKIKEEINTLIDRNFSALKNRFGAS